MIPHILHRIWIGEIIPEEFESYWEDWGKLHPDWDLQTWDESTLGWLDNIVAFQDAPNAAAASDIARYEVLARYGGVYVDADVQPLRAIDELCSHRAFAGYEDDWWVNNAVIGAEAHHPLLEACVQQLPGSIWVHRDEAINLQAGPMFFTNLIRSGRWDITLLPPVAFYPYHYSVPDPGTYPAESYAVHRWAKSWL